MTERDSAPATAKVLLLEDSEFDAELIKEHLRRVEPEPTVARTISREDFVRALEQDRYDLILADYSLPGFDGMTALEIAAEKAPETPFIFVSGVLGEEIATEAFRKGATDYVMKQRLIRLPSAVDRALAEAREKAERRRAEQQMELLVAELSHRVKNILAMVMSIARRTAKSSRTVQQYEETFLSRMRALSDAHALVFEANWGDTTLQQVLERTLTPFRREGDRTIRIEGPRVKLEPKAALALSLIFHELVTNATKYGALSVEKGQVTAQWSIDPQHGSGKRVTFVWRESDGPAVTPPQEKGFGTTLLERSMRYELDGGAVLDFQETGLVCELQFSAGQD